MTRFADLTPNARPFTAPSRMIAVASGKGGVGKTFVSITLAHALAFQGKRVLLFDGDLGTANVDVQLGLSPARDLLSVLSGEVELADAVTRYGEEGKVGFDVLAGSSGSGALGALSPQEVIGFAKGLRMIGNSYDHIIVDLAAGLEPPVTLLAAAADQILTVVTDEPTSLTDAYAFIKVMHRHKPDLAARVVINQAEHPKTGKKTYESIFKACRTFLKYEPGLAAIIPSDGEVKDTIRHQMPLMARHPNTPAAKAIANLAESFSVNVN